MINEPLKTVGLVRAYMQEMDPKQVITDADLCHFSCMSVAKYISEQYSRKEFAAMLSQGIAPIGTLVALQAILDQIFDDLNTPLEVEIADCQLRIEIAEFIGNNVVKQELQDRLKRLIELDELY